MTSDLTALALATLLWVVYLLTFATMATVQKGLRTTLGPRDGGMTLTGIGGRVQRAERNHLDSLILFSIAVVITHLAGGTSGLTANLCWIYLMARIAYLPAYISGVPVLRSLIWSIGLGATLLLLIMVVL